MVEIAAVVYCMLALIVVFFQFALAAGAPWGALTMGGFHPGVLPKKLRIAAVGQALLIIGSALIVLVEARLLLLEVQTISGMGIWFVVVLYSISSILNLASSSVWERRTGAPIALGMLACSIIVALA